MYVCMCVYVPCNCAQPALREKYLEEFSFVTGVGRVVEQQTPLQSMYAAVCGFLQGMQTFFRWSEALDLLLIGATGPCVAIAKVGFVLYLLHHVLYCARPLL
jgi:hypothetical protein